MFLFSSYKNVLIYQPIVCIMTHNADPDVIVRKFLISVSPTQTHPLRAATAEPDEAFLTHGEPYKHESN